MSILYKLSALFPAWWYFFGWRDFIEIGLFSIFLHYLICWLKQDTHQKLLVYLYGYVALLFTAYIIQLPTIAYCLIFFAPAFGMIFLITHQEALQRNIVAYKNINAPFVPIEKDWISLLIRISLINVTNKKPFLCVIEHTDNIKPFMTTPYPIQAPINQGLLEFLTQSSLYLPNELLWITSKGILRGINCNWHHQHHNASLFSWEDEAAAYTIKTDSLVIYADPHTHTLSLMMHGINTQNLTTQQTIYYIKKQICYPDYSEKGAFYDAPPKKHTAEQRTH